MRQVHETMVGALVLIFGGGFMIFAFTGGGLINKGGYPLMARFSQVDGLTVGSDVRVSGVPVGEVTRIEIEPATRKAIVTMTIDESVRLPLDTAALIVQVGILGSKFIKLDPGGEEDMLEPGEELDFVQDSVIILDLLQMVVEGVEARRRLPARDSPQPAK